MRRLSVVARLAALVLVLAALSASNALGEPEKKADDPAPTVRFADLNPRLQRALAEPMSVYLDPTLEFLWRPRKDLVEVFQTLADKHEVDPLKDIDFLRSLVYQGRHFLPRFSDRKWLRDNEVGEFKKTSGTYLNVKSELWRFTYSLPKSYPQERVLSKSPRSASPFPLLVTIHEGRDETERGKASKYPGEICLKRRFPKNEFGALYEKWLLLAPVAARAKFLDEDGRVRHRFLTQIVTEFWRHYHVDFDRIVLDGKAAAAGLAATFPQILAGVVLRKGTKVQPGDVQNFANVPVFVVDDPKLEKALKEAGHKDVVVGSKRDVIIWLNKRKRVVPTSFDWNVLRADQLYCNWITIDVPDFSAGARTMSVQVLDTEADPNTIKIDAQGIEELSLYLNDQHVDLDREIRLLINGHETKAGPLERSLDQVFMKGAKVRVNMNFGWLYPAVLLAVKVLPPAAAEDEPADGTEEPTEPEDTTMGSPEDEARAEGFWNKALAAEAEGSLTKARVFYAKVRDIGTTSYLARAEAKLDELKNGKPPDD